MVSTPALQKQFEAIGTDAKFMGPGEFGTYVAKESTRWTRAFRDSGLAPK